MDAENRLTWKRTIIRSLIICGAVALLSLWRPIWITPPFFKLTVILYVLLAWIGLFFLVSAAWRRPVGRASIGVLGIIVNILLSLLLSGVIVLIFAFGPSECSRTSTMSYRCTSTFFYSGTTRDFVSLPYFPLMLQISSTSSSTSSFG